MGMLKEFREFAVKGNVTDMAVGIIIGAAFGKIVSSLVADMIMPPLGILLGGVNFTSLKLTLREVSPPVTVNYGAFIQAVFDFTIVAFAMFLLVKGINQLKRREEQVPASPAKPPNQELLLAEIRDLLKEKTEQLPRAK